jgi:hypothetical protein
MRYGCLLELAGVDFSAQEQILSSSPIKSSY